MQCVLLSAVLASVLSATWATPHTVHYSSPPQDNDDVNAHKAILADHFKHMGEVAAFTCHEPQTRAWTVQQLLPGQSHYKSFIPDVTVLRVCDHSCGTCLSGQVCAPAHKTTIKRTFKVTFLEDFEYHNAGDSIYEQHDFLEHTACSCQQKSHH